MYTESMSKKIILKPEEIVRSANLRDVDAARKNFSYEPHVQELVWFDHGKINAAYNAVTKNAYSNRRNKVALYYEGEDGHKEKFTFQEVEERSNQIAHYLKDLGVEKGDRVFIFLPRIPELYFAFIATLKIGAVAGTMFSAFGPQALFDRLDQSDAHVLITTKDLSHRLDSVRRKLPHLKHILITDGEFGAQYPGKSKEFDCAKTNDDDDAFMLYTSGTTGKPKGVVHGHKSILHQYLTAKWVLDLKENDVYWCTADPGWVTGIAYEILGTWANGASTVVTAARFDPADWYRIIQDYKVNVWYSAPTAVRMLAAQPDDLHKKYDLSSLRHLASVGEPLNPEIIFWSEKAFGLPFHDNYFQTETGGIMIANYPSLPMKPGSMGKPFPGIKVHIVDAEGNPLPHNSIGRLTFEPNWPSLMKKLWRRHNKYESYFMKMRPSRKKLYVTGDLAYLDEEGYVWFVGRDDDVIKTSGERVGPFEVESALVEHGDVIEAGVIGKPDELRGQIIKAFVVLKKGVHPSEQKKEEISQFVKKNLAGHAYPREIEFVEKLPKTRSGKIMRRILKAQEMGLPIGDTSTLEEY
jgi:acetyl-CoA synthetase